MELFQIGFLHIRLLDFLDILIVAFLLYKAYNLLRGNVAVNIFIAILIIYLIWLLCAKLLHLQLLGNFLGQFISIGVLVLIIIFQPEIRRFLILLGANNIIAKRNWATQILSWTDNTNTIPKALKVQAIVRACTVMSKNKTGALIIIERKSDLQFYINTGDAINAELSSRLLQSIFYKNSPMHDGAVIIGNNQIKAARCILPITDNPDLPARLGTRHRAAIGISEQTDAIALIVSEETGEISIAENGELTAHISSQNLEDILNKIGKE